MVGISLFCNLPLILFYLYKQVFCIYHSVLQPWKKINKSKINFGIHTTYSLQHSPAHLLLASWSKLTPLCSKFASTFRSFEDMYKKPNAIGARVLKKLYEYYLDTCVQWKQKCLPTFSKIWVLRLHTIVQHFIAIIQV